MHSDVQFMKLGDGMATVRPMGKSVAGSFLALCDSQHNRDNRDRSDKLVDMGHPFPKERRTQKETKQWNNDIAVQLIKTVAL